MNKDESSKLSTGATSYKTSDLAVSAFLMARGHVLLDIQNERGRGIFVFAQGGKLKDDLLAWGNNDQVSLRIRDFVNSMRDLKGLISIR